MFTPKIKILLFSIFIFTFINNIFAQEEFYKSEFKKKTNFYKKYNANISHNIENQSNYDAQYYRLELDIDTLSKTFKSKVGITVQVVNQPIDSLVLDFTNHNFANPVSNVIDSILIGSYKATYSHSDSLLSVHLDRKYNVGETIQITVYYLGKNDNYYFLFFTSSGRPNIFTVSEPFGARFWWPCKDDPRDKADSVDLLITVPGNLIVASNGTLKSKIKNNDKTTYHWHESYPIATYLVSLAIYPYAIYSNYYNYCNNESMEIQYYVFPNSYDRFIGSFEMIPKMIGVLSEMYGQYPFIKEKYGEAEISFPMGIENQTITSFAGWGERIKLHELSHSWWGNMITCRDFHHIWLNEGFARYSEALYSEKVYGREAYMGNMRYFEYKDYGTIYRDTLTDDGYIFYGGTTYNKSAWVHHMLRHVVSDSIYFKTIKELALDNKFRFKTIDTDEFRQYFESFYGKDLNWFFNQWIYGEYYPVYEYKWTQDKTDTSIIINLNIHQVQNKTKLVFKMPIDITFYSKNGDTTIVVVDSLKSQDFTFSLKNIIDSINLDKDEWILKDVKEIKLLQILTPESAFDYYLYQNYPNPFNSATTISYMIRNNGYVTLKIYDILGREVKTVVNSYLNAGKYKTTFDGSKVSSGLYFYKLKTEGFEETKKFILLK